MRAYAGRVISPRKALAASLVFALGPLSAAEAQGMGPTLQKTFAGCQLSLTRSSHLDLVAQAYARIGKVRPAAAEAKYPYQNMQGSRIPDPLMIPQTIRQRCADYQGLIEYGFAPYGRGIALVVADPKVPPHLQGPKPEGLRLLQATNVARSRGANCGGKWYPAAPPLVWDDRLFAAAQVYSKRLAGMNFTGHVDPHTGANSLQRATAAGFRGSAVGENLAYGPNTAELAVKDLLTSPGHCQNIMNPTWKVMAGAYATSDQSDYGIYWAQMFGAP